MKVSYECAPCMLRQVCEAIEHAVDDEDKKMNLTLQMLEYVNEHFDKNVRSNKLGTDIHHKIMDLTGNHDPYKTLREQGNKLAYELIPAVEESLKENPTLENYVKAAVVGNIIDFGALDQSTDMHAMIKEQLKQPLVINDTEKLGRHLEECENILYLTDNGGEIVFDKLLIHKIKQDYDVKITLALKENPILNDAIVQDAKDLHLDRYAELISTGASSVGVVEDYISDELKELIKSSDIIISKGMGNYEGLTEMKIDTPVYFMLNTKCNVISKQIGVDLRSNIILYKNHIG